MQRVHKIALDLTNVQATGCAKAAGCARVAYNWALRWWKDAYHAWLISPEEGTGFDAVTGKEIRVTNRPSENLARRHFDMIKGEEFPWMYESTKCAPQEAIRDLGRAFSNFFAGRASYPKAHKKGVNDSFRLSPGQYSIKGKLLRIPNIGWVRMQEELRYPATKTLSVTITRHRNRWFAAIACELPDPHQVNRPFAAVGVDLGTGDYATSDGQTIQVPRAYRKAQSKLRRAQKALSRKKKGSQNRIKAKIKVNKIHGRVADIRSNWIHQFTHHLVTNYSVIGIEDLNVKGMSKNRHLAKSILDAGFYEFRRQLEYKAPTYGAKIIVADRWFPSSKICSQCGEKTNRLTSLAVRSWECENCGASHHRDINAAVNLKNYAVSSTVSACGEFFASDITGSSGTPSSLCEAGTRHQIVLKHI